MKVSNKYKMFFVIAFVFTFTGCEVTSSNHESISLIGSSEVELEESNVAVTINFTGKKSEKSSFVTLVKSGVLSQFDPKLQYENMYLEGEGSSREFTYSMSFLLILKDIASLDVILKTIEKENLSVYVNTAGIYIYPESRGELLTKLFDEALENGIKRISEHAKSKGKEYKVTAVADADDSFSAVIPLDGIAYQNKLYKKVQVTAELY
ncbi:hypothetical protein [Mongoliitalea lutea]|uniref:Lipoprotein n=1 Tax=Mongoliitalea lutea TaxID=849756 RepID=A0A8J3CU85_9BACT|nr:hypothetical protein [Mongoliitalea lutea]GHB26217.1 hypothetical protein GCM10008106_03490 [Mongoliitalea lutea]